MKDTVFFELEFFLLIASSIVMPIGIYVFLLRTRAISRLTVLVFASILVALSGADVFLLKTLSNLAKVTLSLLDDKLFSSELSVALYILPVVFAGIGVNLVSHVLIAHLTNAEQKFDQKQTILKTTSRNA